MSYALHYSRRVQQSGDSQALANLYITEIMKESVHMYVYKNENHLLYEILKQKILPEFVSSVPLPFC